MLKHIQIVPLIVGIVLGIFGIFFMKPQQNVVYKYPTPESAKTTIYKDNNGVCYKYIATEVNCDKNETRLKDFPITK